MYRHLADVVGYTADADTFCSDCAAEMYPAHCSCCGKPGRLFDPGWHDERACRKVRQQRPDLRPDDPSDPGYFRAYDGEGNEVSAIFVEHIGDEPFTCGKCGCEID